ADSLPLPVGGLGMARDHLDLVYRYAVAGIDVGPPRAEALREHPQARQRLGARNRNPFPDFARPELGDDRRRAADVIRVAVRQRDTIDAPEARVANDGRDHAIADVEARAR